MQGEEERKHQDAEKKLVIDTSTNQLDLHQDSADITLNVHLQPSCQTPLLASSKPMNSDEQNDRNTPRSADHEVEGDQTVIIEND